MRIKKDKDSWHAGGVLTRDARHDKSFDGPTGTGKKKNTKRWCKGVEGRLHEPVWRLSKWASWGRRDTHEVACKNCGKVFEVDHGFLGRPKKGRDALLAKWRMKLGVP